MPEHNSPSDPVGTVVNIALAYLVSRGLHVAAELGIADRLRAGPQEIAQLAEATGAHPKALRRLLRSLASHGVFQEQADGRFALNDAAALLSGDAMRDGLLFCGEVTGDGSWWSAVGALRESVLTGEPAFDRQHGMGFFDYMKRNPECSAWFDRGMAGFATAENPAMAAALDLSGRVRIVDIGGGQGGFLAEVLKIAPDVHAMLFDLPAVAANPAGLSSGIIGDRWSAVGGDFFQSVPDGADGYVLKRILHDWSDEHCLAILRNCRAAMHPGSVLWVMDAVIPEGNDPHPAKTMDILMMVFGEGHERTEREFSTLFEQAGLKLHCVTATPTSLSIIEAVPA